MSSWLDFQRPSDDGRPWPVHPEAKRATADLAAEPVGPRTRRMLERVAQTQRSAARIFRGQRMDGQAFRAERFASRIDLILDRPQSTQRMHALIERVRESSHLGPLLERALEGAMSLTGADLGNVQLRDWATDTLRIATQAGFNADFLEHFSVVKGETSVCGRAAQNRRSVVVVDVNRDAGFVPHRAVAAASGFRAVQSSPLIDQAGCLRGVVSTHFPDPHELMPAELETIDWYAEEVATLLFEHQVLTANLHAAAAVLHQQSADRQDRSAAVLSGHQNHRVEGGPTAAARLITERARRARVRAARDRERARALVKP